MQALFHELGFTPHSQSQWDYCKSTTRFNIPCCGRRWGKSIATGHRITYKAFIPDSHIWIVGPTYRLAEKEYRVVFNDILKLEARGLKSIRKTYNMKQGDMSIKLPWNTIIEAVSAEKPDSLVGEGLTHVVMSEAAQHPRSIWEQYIEPALSDRLGTADFPSTPRGYNWYHGLWMLGQDANEPLYNSWRLPTWTNEARFPGGLNNTEIQRIKKIVSSPFWKQEYGAEFTTVVGEIYEDFNRDIHVRQHTYNPDWANFLSFDFGFDNPTVCLDIQVDPMDNVYVWREFYSRYTSSPDNALLIKNRENPPNYRIDAIFGDPRGADEIAVMTPYLGHFTSNSLGWKLGIEEIRRFLKPQTDGLPRIYFDPSCVNLIPEMEQLHIRAGKEGTNLNEYSADGNIQHKHNDHGPDALRYFFDNYFILGSNSHLSDVYTPGDYLVTESADFMRLHSSVILSDTDDLSLLKTLY